MGTAIVGGAFAAVILLLVTFFILKSFLFIGRPNEILIFSGGEHKQVDGSTRGYRLIRAGFAVRNPLIETVDRLDLRVIPVNIHIKGAYSKGGIPLNVHAIANIKISKDPQKIGQAIERFLGRDRSEIMRVAQETLEGNLRGVLATLTPEDVNENRLRFVEELAKDAEPDLRKLGLHLDTLKIQNISDERDYLDSIGRVKIAQIIKQAEVAESDAMKEAEEVEATQQGRSEVARRQAQAQIQKAQNELRQLTAEFELRAKSEEEKATARAMAARAESEQELQQVRTTLENIRLQADVVIPAEINKAAREYIAAGEAAEIAEKGRAMAEVLQMMASVWREAGTDAMDIFLLQRMEGIVKQMAEAARQVRVREVAIIDSGDGMAIPNYVSSFPRIVSSLFKELRDTMGIDINGALTGEQRAALEGVAAWGDEPAPKASRAVSGASASQRQLAAAAANPLEDSLRAGNLTEPVPVMSDADLGTSSETRPSFAALQRKRAQRSQDTDPNQEG